MARNRGAILLIADISGFTRFLKQPAVSAAHAREIVVRLLNALVAEARPPLRLAEIEGDALFLYALDEGKGLPATLEEVKGVMRDLFATFLRERVGLHDVTTCACSACGQVERLRLKQVLHTGEMAFERIGPFEKPFGYDVIVVHRMLKNTVPVPEYVMMSADAHRESGGFFGLPAEKRREDFEGVGPLDTVVFYPAGAGFGGESPARPRPGIRQKAAWRARISARFVLDLVRGKGMRTGHG
jgi:hypothetical protein